MDTRDLPDGHSVQADVCVVGAGAAGIALALEFVDSPVRVALLEGGGLTAERNGRRIYQVLAGSTPGLSVDPSRTWYFGGNTNHWNGTCRPLDDADFAPRDWVAHSGWPIRKQQLLPYYERAQAVCGLDDFRWYDLDMCRPHLKRPPFDVDPAVLTTKVVHPCPVLSFAALHRERLAAAANVCAWLHARALRLRTNLGGDHVHTVEIAGADGRRSHVEADVFVLAAGGIENARLLLCSNDVHPRGLGNMHDLVGRFFMDHWYLDVPLGGGDDALDTVFYEEHPTETQRVWGQLVLSEELMHRERASGLSLWFIPVDPATPSVGSAHSVMALMRRWARPERLLTDVQLALNDPGHVAAQALRRLSRRRNHQEPRQGRALRVQIEQTPDPENRIRLSARRDRFGQPDVQLVFRLTDQERRGHAKSLGIAAAALGLNGQRLARRMQLVLGAGRIGSLWHHMGTTRMHSDPEHGVVDGDCRVHGIANLFVAGCSVFPTGGTAPPTLTIVALALRLADHLRHRRGTATI